MKTVLSVDWDYFLPICTDSFDWGHNEGNAFFYELAWPLRATAKRSYKDQRTAYDLIQVEPMRVFKFWSQVLAGIPKKICLVDSHKEIVAWIESQTKQPIRVINFDAHHDFCYTKSALKIEELNCGNWAGWMKLKTQQLKHYTLVYPKWRKKESELTTFPLGEHIDRIVYGDWQVPIKADYVFLCRSSCWMPSWCDEQWLTLAGMLKLRTGGRFDGCKYIESARPYKPVEFAITEGVVNETQA